MCILFTHDGEPPKFRSLLCYVGFGVAIVWIYLVANEVVSLLQVRKYFYWLNVLNLSVLIYIFIIDNWIGYGIK